MSKINKKYLLTFKSIDDYANEFFEEFAEVEIFVNNINSNFKKFTLFIYDNELSSYKYFALIVKNGNNLIIKYI